MLLMILPNIIFVMIRMFELVIKYKVWYLVLNRAHDKISQTGKVL